MKKILMVLVIVMGTAAAVFAGGNSENRQAAPGAGNGQGPVLQAASTGETEEVSLTGTLVMKDGFLVLSTGDTLYSLGGPGTRLYMDDFEEGDVVEIEGLLMSDCEDGCDRDLDGHIFMEKVLKDGEEYVFAPGSAGNGTRRGGMDAARGNARGAGKNTSRTGTGSGYRWSQT